MRVYELRNKTGLAALSLTERADPRPGPDQVLVKMTAAALNYRDSLVVNGFYPEMPLPLVPLSDGVGRVIAVGENVHRIKVGDRVSGVFDQNWLNGAPPCKNLSLGGDMDGVLAEYVVLDQNGVVHVPEHLTDEEAATLPCAAVTAWNALMAQDQLKPGSTVLVQGTGGVSLFALQFARMAGARVIVTSSSDEKLDLALSMGAAEVINYIRTPEWDQQVLGLTDGKGVDSVIEIGGGNTVPRSINAVRRGGCIHLVGLATGMTAEVFIPSMLVKQIRLQGIYVGSRSMFEQMNEAIDLHKMKPVIDRVFPFEEAIESFHYLAKGSHTGKICIRF